MLFILITGVDMYRLLHMNAPLKRYPLLASVAVQLVTSELQKTPRVRFPKTRKF